MNMFPSKNEVPSSSGSQVDLSNPPGVLGDLARQILDAAPLADSATAVNAVLALAGTVLARKVCGQTGLRTNIYLISLLDDPDAAGQIGAAVRQIAQDARIEHHLVEETPSGGEALLGVVARTPTALFQFSDFDRLIAAALKEDASRHKMELFLNLIKLLSSADTVLHGTEFADQVRRPRVDIPYPCCSLHAFAKTGGFYTMVAGLRRDHLRFLSRFVITDGENKPSSRSLDDGRSEAAATRIRAWFESARRLSKNGIADEVDPASPIQVTKSAEASRLFDIRDLDARIGDRSGAFGDLWSRSWELADKVALICACADNPEAPVVESRHAEWAIQFVTRHTERLVNKLEGVSSANSAKPSRVGSHRTGDSIGPRSSAVQT